MKDKSGKRKKKGRFLLFFVLFTFLFMVVLFFIYHSKIISELRNQNPPSLSPSSMKTTEQTPISINPTTPPVDKSLLSSKLKYWSASAGDSRDKFYPFTREHNSKPFELTECPFIPPPTNSSWYPKTYSMIEITNNWNTDSTEIPPFHFDGLCHFDFKNETERKMAIRYRDAELPFVMRNIPELDEVVDKWSDVDYLQNRLGKDQNYGTETSKNNHFMYWTGGKKKFLRAQAKEKIASTEKWEPPTGHKETRFESWLEVATRGQNISLEKRVHEYFRVTGFPNKENAWLYQELPFYNGPSLMIIDPHQQQGIHCRFGMRSVVAEAHFDGSNNAVVMLGGLRRWILTHPNQCVNMHMLPREHPSGRHSEVDWSKPDIKAFPNFAKIRGNEVILKPGDFLYVPTFWIHYIVSLNVNYQCNSRSGRFPFYDTDIKNCGF